MTKTERLKIRHFELLVAVLIVFVLISSSTAMAASTVSSAPRSLTATAGNAQVVLTWSAPSSNGGTPITGYKIYRGTTSGGEVAVHWPGNVLTYTDTGLTNGVTYYYKVTALNSAGESGASNEASAKPITSVKEGAISAKFTITSSGGTYTAKSADGTTLASGTNAASIINAALNALTSGRTTKEKVLLQGSFAITSSISLPSFSILDATGAKLTWGTSSGIMVYATSKSNIEVIGGDWNKNNVQWEVFTFNSCTDIIIRDLEAHNAVYDGIACNKCDRITVSNVEIGTVGHTALVMGQTSNSVVEDCHFYDCRTGGGCYFLVEDVANGVSSNNEMRNNLVERTYLSGLSLCSLRAASDVGTNNIADGNTCIDCGRDGSHPGIACGWSEGVVSNIATDCTISDNLVYGTGAYSLGGGMMLTVSDSLVTNNTVHDTTDFGMAVFGSRNTISYNTIYDVVTSCYPGIVLQDASNNQVVHNTISHCPYGVMVVYDDTGSGCNYNHIAYNHFESISYQIAYVHDKACVGNIFESNTYKGTWTAYDAGTGTIIRNNIKQL